MDKDEKMIAVCGLICKGCDIMEASSNPDIAKEIANWFEEERGIKINIDDIHCAGCRGKKELHWSSDCWILKCCYDEKGLNFCYKCEDFPCDKLKEWAKSSKRYGEALKRLEKMKKDENATDR